MPPPMCRLSCVVFLMISHGAISFDFVCAASKKSRGNSAHSSRIKWLTLLQAADTRVRICTRDRLSDILYNSHHITFTLHVDGLNDGNGGRVTGEKAVKAVTVSTKNRDDYQLCLRQHK